MQYYKFVKWDVPNVENVLKNPIPLALAEYDKGNKKPFKNMNLATTDPYYKCAGWCFPLWPYLKKYWVKTKDYGILEYFAINKTAIRNELKSQVIKIIEV